MKQGYLGKILVEKSPILKIVSCLHDNFSKHGSIWIIILDGFLHGNIWSKGFAGKSIFTSEVYSVQSGVLPVYYSDHAAIYSILQ